MKRIQVYHISAEDLIEGMDIFIAAKNKKEAVQKYLKILENRINEAIENITNELDNEEYEYYISEEILEED